MHIPAYFVDIYNWGYLHIVIQGSVLNILSYTYVCENYVYFVFHTILHYFDHF